jgi:hypothetical protein
MHTEDILVHLWGGAAAETLTTNNKAVKMWLRQQLRCIFFVERNSDPSRIEPFPALTTSFNPRT